MKLLLHARRGHSQAAPIPLFLRLAQPCAVLASCVHAPVRFREAAWSLPHGLPSLVVSKGALLLLIHVARRSYIASPLHTHQVAVGLASLFTAYMRCMQVLPLLLRTCVAGGTAYPCRGAIARCALVRRAFLFFVICSAMKGQFACAKSACPNCF